MANHVSIWLITASCTLFTFHGWSRRQDWVVFCYRPICPIQALRWILSMCQRTWQFGLKPRAIFPIRLQLDDMRLMHFDKALRLITRWSLAFLAIQVFALSCISESDLPNLPRTTTGTLIVHLVCLPYANGWAKLQKHHIIYWYTLVKLVMCIAIFFAEPKNPTTTMGSGGRIAVRFMLGIALLDFNKSVPWNACYSLLECWKYVEVLRTSDFDVDGTVCVSILMSFYSFLALVVILYFVEMASESFVKASQAQQIATRKILSVLSDADVQLSSDLKIVKPSPKLCHLLSDCTNRVSLQGKEFSEIILESDRQRFIDFVASCKQTFSSIDKCSGQKSDDVDDSLGPPASMQVHLCMQDVSLPVELFHVHCPEPNNEIGHLIVIRMLGHGVSAETQPSFLRPELPDVAQSPLVIAQSAPYNDDQISNAESGSIWDKEISMRATCHQAFPGDMSPGKLVAQTATTSDPNIVDGSPPRSLGNLSPPSQAKKRPVVAVVRHADRCDGKDHWDRAWFESDDRKLFPHDPPITQQGVERARELASRLRACGEFQIVVSSPYLRCVQTALIIAEHLGAVVVLDHELGELLGPPAFQELTENPWRPLSSLASALLAWCPPGYKSLESRVDWQHVFGKAPQWPETLDKARRRYARRFLTYLRRSRKTQRNFVAITHFYMLPVCLRLLPITCAWDVDTVSYCSAIVAWLHKSAPLPEQDAGNATVRSTRRSRSLDKTDDDIEERPPVSPETGPGMQIHEAGLRWWKVDTSGVDYNVPRSLPDALCSSTRSRLLEDLGPSWAQIQRLLGTLPSARPERNRGRQQASSPQSSCYSRHGGSIRTGPDAHTDASTEIFRTADPSTITGFFPTSTICQGYQTFTRTQHMMETRPLPKLNLQLGSALAKRRARNQ